MTSQRQPRFLKGGIVLLDPDTGEVQRTLPMLINPATLSRSFEVRSKEEEDGRSAPLRLVGPAVETISVEAKLEVSDALARGDTIAEEEGVRHYIAALQLLVTPPSDALQRNDVLQCSGALEIVLMDQPLALFVWGPTNILPVRVTAASVVEEFFNPRLMPLSAMVTLSLRSLSVDDLGFASRGGAIYLSYLRAVEASAARLPAANTADLGIEGAL